MSKIYNLSTIFLFMLFSASSFANNSIPIEARRLIKERDMLYQKLLRADRKAADAVLMGEDPLEMHASQTGLQEQVDILQMRLESLAIRFDFSLPELLECTDAHEAEDLLEPHIAVGRERTDQVIRRRCRTECRELLLQIQFEEFLDF